MKMKIAKRMIVPAIVLFVLYALLSPPHHVWHQKLTVAVTTPQGSVTGSAVTQVERLDLRNFSFGFPEAGGISSSFSGEAVAVEVAPGRVLFVLLEKGSFSGGPSDWPTYIWYKSRMTSEDFMALIKQQRGKEPEPLPEEHWPLMATFDDLSRPETLHIITGRDLSPWFGPGFKVDGLTLQVTDEPMTRGKIETLLPWLLSDSYLRGPVAPAPAPLLPFTAFLSIDHWRNE